MSRFPKDCWDKNCEHFHVTDMSIDDLLCACDVSGMECDACNEDFSFAHCPLELDIKFSENIFVKTANKEGK